MQNYRILSKQALVAAILALSLPLGSAWAEKAGQSEVGQWQHKNKAPHGKKQDREFRQPHQRLGDHSNKHGRLDRPYFSDQHRSVFGEYYRNEFNKGSCPPGLQRKHNGCLPPGQAKRWAVGQPLPRDVVFYDLPEAVVRQIGYPPAGYRMVRVGTDVLMLAIGTGLVVDAITGLLGTP